MYLAQMKETVEMFAAAISKVLDVDVMIVDKDLNRVGNTFRYPDKPIQIRKMSIIGQVISTGQLLTIDDKTNYHTCKNCPDIDQCEITGLIGVPIFFHGEVVGAIALVVPNRNTSILYKNFRNSTDFLEKMADLLSSKIQNIYDYNNLNLIKKEREIIMDSMEDAIFSIDELGYVTYHNNKFTNYFGVDTDLIGTLYSEVFDHPIIKDSFESRNNLTNKLVYVEYKQKAFYGFLSAISIVIGGVFKGMLFAFKSINKFNYAFNEVTTKTSLTFSKFLGNSTGALKKTVDNAKRLSVTDKIILIQSEEGCGKEVLARAIHNFSNYSNGYFVKVNCHDLAMDMLEKEIFGYDNSHDMSSGMAKIWLAQKGTLYFHEINELSLYLQKRITDFIKTRTIRQANVRDIKIDTKMIFSASVSLSDLVEQGKFDEELYYWISSNALYLPTLRERQEDLVMLINQSLEFFAKQYKVPTPKLDSELMTSLCTYSWPKNLKELEKVTEQIVYHSQEGLVTLNDISYLSLDLTTSQEIKSMDEIEREHIMSMLMSKKNKDEIAKLLNISRATLYRKIKKYNLMGVSNYE